MRAAREAARADVVTRTRSIALATVRAYAGAVAAGRRVDVLRDAIAATDEAERVVTAMVEQEVLPRSDQLAARYRRDELRAQLATAEADEVAVRAGLAALVGQEVGSLAALPSLPTPAPDRESSRLAAEPSELRALEQRRQALLEAGAAASADRLPVLVALGRLEHTTDDYVLHRTNALAAVTVRVPLFDGGAAAARAAALTAEARALESATEMERRRIEGELQAKMAAEKAGFQRVTAAEQAVVAAAEALRLERLRHAEGLATTRDLLAALADDTAARASQAAAQAGLVVAVAERADAAGQDVVALFGEE
jgi:outer membrane protein TolC